jgi:hypothetical protein
MKNKKVYLIVLAGALSAIGLGILSSKLIAAEPVTTSCCGAAALAEPVAERPGLAGPVKLVYDHYLRIQADLASDSLAGVADNANAIAKFIQNNTNAMPAEVRTQAQTLANASDLTAARAAFKSLSVSLIKHLSDHQVKSAYVRVYCPMARASWLQADKNVNNPYFGSAMSGCGELQD